MYGQNISAAPSKINLFEDEEDDLDEDLLKVTKRLLEFFNKEDKTLLLDLGRIHQIVLSEKRKKKTKS